MDVKHIATYAVTFRFVEQGPRDGILTKNVNISTGYSTFSSIPKILETFYGREVIILAATLIHVLETNY